MLRRAERRQVLVAERAPAIAGEHAQAGRDRPTHHELHFVIRVIGHGRAASFAPAPRGDARWCPSDARSDRCCRRMPADRRRRRSSGGGWRQPGDGRRSRIARARGVRHPQPPARQRLALERVDRAVVPRQDVATQLPGAAWSTNASSSSSRVGASVASRAGVEIDRGREVPAEDEDRVARVEQRASHQPEVVRGILDAVNAASRVPLASSFVPAE